MCNMPKYDANEKVGIGKVGNGSMIGDTSFIMQCAILNPQLCSSIYLRHLRCLWFFTCYILHLTCCILCIAYYILHVTYYILHLTSMTHHMTSSYSFFGRDVRCLLLISENFSRRLCLQSSTTSSVDVATPPSCNSFGTQMLQLLQYVDVATPSNVATPSVRRCCNSCSK
jgi:hypothetical protein